MRSRDVKTNGMNIKKLRGTITSLHPFDYSVIESESEAISVLNWVD